MVGMKLSISSRKLVFIFHCFLFAMFLINFSEFWFRNVHTYNIYIKCINNISFGFQISNWSDRLILITLFRAGWNQNIPVWLDPFPWLLMHLFVSLLCHRQYFIDYAERSGPCFHVEEFQLFVTSQYWEIIENSNIFHVFVNETNVTTVKVRVGLALVRDDDQHAHVTWDHVG